MGRTIQKILLLVSLITACVVGVFVYKMGFQSFKDIRVFAESLWYGNTVEGYANKIGLKNWEDAIVESGFPSSEIHKQFLRDGYVVLGQIFDPKDIESLQKEFNHAITSSEFSTNIYDDENVRKAQNYNNFEGDVSSYRRDIKDCARALPTVVKLWNNEQFKKTLQQILRCDYAPDDPSVLSWRICHVPQHIAEQFEINTNRFHFDDQYVDRIKVFIYLSDVTQDDGPFQHFPKQYSRRLILKGFQKNKRVTSPTGGLDPDIVNSDKLIKHTGKAGTVIVCATSLCLHRAGEPEVGHWRDLVQLSIRPKRT